MKHSLSKLIAIVLVTAMIASMCACSATNNNPIIGTIGKVKIDFSKYQSLYQQYATYIYSDTSNSIDFNDLIKEQLITYGVTLNQCYELGIELDEEDEKELQNRINESIEEAIATYASQVDESITDEDAIYEAKLNLFKEALRSGGSSYDKYLEGLETDHREAILMEKLKDQVYAEVSITNEEVKAYFEEQVEKDAEAYDDEHIENFYNAYKSYIDGSGIIPFYNPNDVFGVKHLLLKYTNSDEVSDDVPGEFNTEDKATLDSIYEAIKEGNTTTLEEFEALIEEHGDDPGMEEEGYMKHGYIMHEELMDKYYGGFSYAAMKLYAGHDWEPPVEEEDPDSTPDPTSDFAPTDEEPVTYDVEYFTINTESDPVEIAVVETDLGFHFIYIQQRLTAGNITFVDDPENEVWQNIRDFRLEELQEKHYNEQYDIWESNTKIRMKDSYIDQIASTLYGI